MITKFKNKKNFSRFLCEIDNMGQNIVEDIMGDNYIDTPGFYKEDKKYYNGIEDFMLSNMGNVEFNRLKLWWETNIKIGEKTKKQK